MVRRDEYELFSVIYLKVEFEKWVEGALHEELSDAYEEERQKWIREGYKRREQEKNFKNESTKNDEISKRVDEEWGK